MWEIPCDNVFPPRQGKIAKIHARIIMSNRLWCALPDALPRSTLQTVDIGAADVGIACAMSYPTCDMAERFIVSAHVFCWFDDAPLPQQQRVFFGYHTTVRLNH